MLLSACPPALACQLCPEPGGLRSGLAWIEFEVLEQPIELADHDRRFLLRERVHLEVQVRTSIAEPHQSLLSDGPGRPGGLSSTSAAAAEWRDPNECNRLIPMLPRPATGSPITVSEPRVQMRRGFEIGRASCRDRV